MTETAPRPAVKLSKLRDIGWGLWDPIGLMTSEGFYPGKWDQEPNRPFAGEYDSYLISAVSQLRRETPREQVIEYLIEIETQHMGLGENASARDRAVAVVTAILADKEIWTWPDEQERFV